MFDIAHSQDPRVNDPVINEQVLQLLCNYEAGESDEDVDNAD